jgi:DNA-binding transcriptional MerR regulator
MPPTNPPRYSLTELADLAGVTPRTIRYYMSQGLLPSPGSPGPGAKYDDAHLGRLRLIRKLQREHLPLAEIRQRLEGLDDATIATLAETPADEPDPHDSALDYIRRVLGSSAATPARLASHAPLAQTRLTPPMRIRALAAEPLARVPAPGAPHPPMPAPVASSGRSQWERITLAPDIELHVRRPLPRPLAKQVDRLVSIARDLLEEDPS